MTRLVGYLVGGPERPWLPKFCPLVTLKWSLVGYPGVVPGYLGGAWGPLVPGLGPCYNPLIHRCCPWCYLGFVPGYLIRVPGYLSLSLFPEVVPSSLG